MGRNASFPFLVATLLVPPSMPAAGPPVNRLARESSPYLREHQNDPVDWYPWSREAFDKARKEGKLVFVSVGYSACHWCHVMARETFRDPEVARLLNASFVNIKVDREERPDVDQIYQLAVQLLVHDQPGGWPLSVFATADGKPIAVSGMFLPPEDRRAGDRRYPGFKSLLAAVLEAHRQTPKEIEAQSEKVARAIAAAVRRTPRAVGPEPRRYLVTSAIDGLREQYDPSFGGFGNARMAFQGSKFPSAPVLRLLLAEAGRLKSDELLRMVTNTLDHMAAGAIYDQLGGGFHRYTVDRAWATPHFEKMLSENAQLVEIYALAFERTRKPLYRRVVEETLDFVARELTAPVGGFYSSLDADSDGREGAYYLWAGADLDSALPDRTAVDLARTIFALGQAPPVDGTFYVLTRPEAAETTDARVAEVRQTLFTYRSKRSRPFLDDKVVTAWNGQMIAAYAVAGRVLGQPKYTETAAKAGTFLLTNLCGADGRLFRCYAAPAGQPARASVAAYLDDYACLIDGLLRLHDTTGETRWLKEARKLADVMIQLYGDEGGGFCLTANDQENLFARTMPMQDAAQPSGNGVAVRDLLRLADKTGEAKYREIAARVLRTFMADLEQTPAAMPTIALAVDEYLSEKPGTIPEDPAPRVQPGPTVAKRSDSVVKVSATSGRLGPDGRQPIKLVLTIEKGWHVYANPVGNADFEAAATSVTISGMVKPKAVKVDYPKGKIVNDSLVGNYSVYEGRVELEAKVERAAGDTGPLEVTVKFQACNEKTCLLAATVKVPLP
jgi:uncharacterized protein YyaL (SSP411 family)